MKLATGNTVLLSASLLMATGCAGTSSVKNFFAAKTEPASTSDPLANVRGEVSEEFEVAQRELDAPETTMLQFARWREDMGDHVEAMNRYREILKANEKSVEARLGIARIEQATGRIEAATQILEATAKRYPDRSDVWISMGQLEASQNNYVKAIESLKQAVEIDSRDQAARYELGLAYARNGQIEQAQPHLAFAVGQSAACYNIGYVLNEQGQTAEAIQWLERAAASQPDERTLNSSQRLLASIRNGANQSTIARQAPAKIDVELTSYESYRETPAVSVEPRLGNSGSPSPAGTTNSAGSPFRHAVQTRTLDDSGQTLRSAMSALAGQAGDDHVQPMSVPNGSGRAKVDHVPNWNGPSSSGQAVPVIQNQFHQAGQSSYQEPQDWSGR